MASSQRGGPLSWSLSHLCRMILLINEINPNSIVYPMTYQDARKTTFLCGVWSWCSKKSSIFQIPYLLPPFSLYFPLKIYFLNRKSLFSPFSIFQLFSPLLKTTFHSSNNPQAMHRCKLWSFLNVLRHSWGGGGGPGTPGKKMPQVWKNKFPQKNQKNPKKKKKKLFF